jgi:hypothetical protein
MRWIQEFSDGSRDQRELLGGKGAGVAEMTRVLGAERVPAGFTITTEACVAYMEAGRQLPPGLTEEVDQALSALERRVGKALGDPRDPLLVSVRSGARVSMPGMLDTVLNLGLNDESVAGLAARSGSERFAWDSYRRFVQMFGNVVHGIPFSSFERALQEAKGSKGVSADTELGAEELRELTALPPCLTCPAYCRGPDPDLCELEGARVMWERGSNPVSRRLCEAEAKTMISGLDPKPTWDSGSSRPEPSPWSESCPTAGSRPPRLSAARFSRSIRERPWCA